MKFNFSLPDIILSTAKMKIVSFLLNHEAAMSEREIASVLNVSHMSINRFLKEMAEVFGSVAKGLENENSDIDIFVLVKNLEMKKEVEPFMEALSIKCLDLYGNRLASYVLTEHEMKQRSNLNVIKEINQGIAIFPANRGSDVA
jgi:predicted nucleotidyltransferase